MAAVDVSKDGGVMKTVTKPGTGKTPQPGEYVFAHYTGKLPDGSVFDSTIGKPHRKNGFYFKLGAGEVIQGWDVGFASMQVGEQAVLQLKPEYGYGAGGAGPIPPNATLIFEVELLDTKVLSAKEKQDLDAEVARLRG
eukprot:TRINITY_DN65032_c0_g1_i1.p2 TRINITY_DN65032_c0_g1~~TRINITY_DN65032_c0_g1_i1.p2  ORF type:complete len:138 (-),score=36.88 TRINITY_DN65032_c0_g1_i1:55-468(-)